MKHISTAVVFFFFLQPSAWATGFEKDSLWSGEHGGKAGAAVSSAHGPESLYFNPSRLGKTETQQTLSLDFSPTWAQFQSPMGSPQQSHDSELTLSPVFGISYGHKFNDKWAVGVGSHVVGGTNIDHKDVAFGNYTEGNFKTFLSITEIALGASYQVTPEISVGLAWRGTIFQVDYHTVSRMDPGGGNMTAVQTDFSKLKGEDFGGVRFGLNYEPSEKWGLGLTYRSEVSITADGSMKQSAYLEATGNPPPSAPFDQTVEDSGAKLSTKLPQALTLGGHYQLSDKWRLFGEYSWIDYSVVERFEITATGYGPVDDVELNWKDQSIFRVAGEYTGLAIPLRLGYFYSSAVTPKSYAAPNYLGPSGGHGVSVGSGYELAEGLKLNGAIEYYYDSGSVEASDQVSNPPFADTPAVGDYKATAFPVIHLGLSYSF